MQIIRDLEFCPASAKHSVMALGNFDGVHMGHREILRQCAQLARKQGALAAAMTFEPHPRAFFARERGQPHEALRIYPLRHKIEIIRSLGIDLLFILRFNRTLATTSAQDFIEHILSEQLQVRHVVTGYNFAFGKGREGNPGLLTSESHKLGFGSTAVAPVKDETGEMISSSAIRAALQQGDIATASRMLGQPYQISGHVRHGDKRGRTLGYPTANIKLTGLSKPRFGIYAARVSWDGNAPRDGVVSLGIRPMFSATEPLLEAHIFNCNDDLYGKQLTVELGEFIRDEQKFSSTEALIAQINLDCAQAKSLLAAPQARRA